MLLKDANGMMRESTLVKDIAKEYNDTNYVFNHGLNAFTTRSVEENLVDILNNTNMEICCGFNGQYVGTIGVEIKGRCLVAGLKDLNSRKTEEGRAIYNEYIVDIYEGDLNNITKEINNKDEFYGEAIVTNYEVPAVLWFNPYSADTNQQAKEMLIEARRLAAKYNLELKIVMNNNMFF